MGIALYTSRVVLNTLGVEDFGIYNVMCRGVGMVTIVKANFIFNCNDKNGVLSDFRLQDICSTPDAISKVLVSGINSYIVDPKCAHLHVFLQKK